MGYYDETRRKYISKYGRLADLRTSEDDYRAESEREKEIKRIVDRMEDIPSEYLLDDNWNLKKTKKRSRKSKRIASVK